VPPLRTMRKPERKNGPRGGMGDVVSIEHDHPRGRVQQAGDRLQGRGLAGTVRADQRDDLAFAAGERDSLERRHLAVTTTHLTQLTPPSFLLPDTREWRRDFSEWRPGDLPR